MKKLVTAVLIWSVILGSQASARVRLKNICTVYGQREIKLTDIGLVVGLNKTGDGGKNLPAMRALAAALKLKDTPILSTAELRGTNNVAMVLIEATIPRTGIRRGQKLDCYVSSIFEAKSLRGGRLLVSPVETSEIQDDTVIGLCSGAIHIEDTANPTTGKISGRLVVHENFSAEFIDQEAGNVVTLLLDEAHSSFYTASNVAQVVNLEFRFEADKKNIAKAVGPGVIEVVVPDEYLKDAVDFIALVLEVGIDNPSGQAKVVVNAKAGVVIVTGEVEISPAIISHKNLNINVGGNDGGAASFGFRPIPPADETGKYASQQLKQLLDGLNQMQVSADDQIAIIRELYHAGKIHAEYIER